MEKVNKKNIFYFLLGLILLRPSLDIFSQIEFQIHENLPYINLNIIIGGLVFLIGLFFLFKKIKTVYTIPLFAPITLFLTLCFFSIFYSPDTFSGIQEFIRIASIFLLYFLAYKIVETRADWILLLKFVLLSYLLPGIMALIQLITGKGLLDQFGGFDRVYGTFAHPNPFAFYTFFILGLVLALALSQKHQLGLQFDKNILWITSGILAFILFATYTRTALVSLFIFILILGIFKYRKMLLAGIILFFVAYFLSDVFQQRMLELISLDPYGSVVWRLRLWQDLLPISLWQPWFGYGINSFVNLTEFYRGFDWGSLEAHNDYLKIFVENGIFGLVTYFWIIIGLFIYLFKIFKRTIIHEKTLALGILIIALSLFISSSFDNVLRTTALQWNFWILIGAWLKVNKMFLK